MHPDQLVCSDGRKQLTVANCFQRIDSDEDDFDANDAKEKAPSAEPEPEVRPNRPTRGAAKKVTYK